MSYSLNSLKGAIWGIIQGTLSGILGVKTIAQMRGPHKARAVKMVSGEIILHCQGAGR